VLERRGDVAVTLGAVAVIALVVILLIRRPFRRPPTAAASH
jgi:hypothetical protein